MDSSRLNRAEIIDRTVRFIQESRCCVPGLVDDYRIRADNVFDIEELNRLSLEYVKAIKLADRFIGTATDSSFGAGRDGLRFNVH